MGGRDEPGHDGAGGRGLGLGARWVMEREPERFLPFPQTAQPQDDRLWTITWWAFKGHG